MISISRKVWLCAEATDNPIHRRALNAAMITETVGGEDMNLTKNDSPVHLHRAELANRKDSP
jgi:microcystin-dependent protein